MLFNSVTFGFFLVLVFFTYWFPLRGKLRAQNIFLIIASYIFYGWWDWRFLGLVMLSSVFDFALGLKMQRTEDKAARERLLWVSLAFNLGMLGFFKYFNFFADSFTAVLSAFGFEADPFTLKVLLPIGISFYTFQTLSYTIDVYKKQIKATESLVEFMAFVAFFPQLVAGPIERAKNLLPQFAKNRNFDYAKAVDGSRQILWGFFKKIVIADNCAPLVNDIFNNYGTQPGSVLVVGVVLFCFQIYGDFSGYSDIAIGTARLFGFHLNKNFDFPYFSKSMSEMWRRWHISLSTWTNEYIFNPIIKTKGKWGRLGIVYGLLSTFLILGLWHGANWTFVCFGLLHGTVVATEYYFQKQIRQKNKALKSKALISWSGWLVTIVLWMAGMVFFRAADISQALGYFSGIFGGRFWPETAGVFSKFGLVAGFVTLLMSVEWLHRNTGHGLSLGGLTLRPARWAVYIGLVFLMLQFGGQQSDFIYFQF